jgi:nicotinic acid mononucleotide adenylyltransferase
MQWSSSLNKAREINQDPSIYGTFAEIGAGQEVARFFFLAGQASKTVAKTMSAYDMVFSDEIYGKEPNGRYVCQTRLHRMLEKEYTLLLKRLKNSRGLESRFFAFADTVATSTHPKRPSHGWMGVRFQHKIGQSPSQIILHAQLLDSHRLRQQEILGTLGVDLIHSCYFYNQSPSSFLTSLTENIKPGSVEIDFIQTEGPAFENFHNPLLNLELVHRHWSQALFIQPDGNVALLADQIYNQPIVLQRGHFNPVTKTHVDIIEKAHSFQKQEFHLKENSLKIFELTTSLLKKNQEENSLDTESFLHRVAMITSLGYPVLVTPFKEFYKVKKHLRMSTQKPLSVVIPASHLEKIFALDSYEDLPGGLLEGLGKLLDKTTHFYIYPHKTDSLCLNTSSFKPSPPEDKIYSYFMEKQFLKDLAGCHDIDHYIRSEQARLWIETQKPHWQDLLPPPVTQYVVEKGLYKKRSSK